MSLFSEMKRRNVFRVALLYLVGSWLIMQVADVGVSLLSLPDWTGRLVFLLLGISFPLVMVFSWAYEITPEGLKKEKDVERDESITSDTARKLNTAVIVLLLLSLGGMIADRLIPERVVPVDQAVTSAAVVAGPPEQSIAVLPFVNMSADQENEYFSDGLSEELLNLLSKIPELQVAARTSTFSFKGSDAGIPEIAIKLNVAHVLEGSVRKSGDEIRITAQLIKAADGYHLWSETWDRTLVDVFAIQDEIAAAVVAALKVSLLGEVPHVRVTDPRAYELYLRSKAAANLSSREGFAQAALLLTDALAIDPDYAEAWAELSVVQTNQTGQGFIPIEVGFERARLSAERALKIDRDFAVATRLIREARRLAPGNASVLNAYAVLHGVFGRRQVMMGLYEDALERDPVAMSVLGNLSGAYMNYGRNDDAELIVERMRAIEPDSAWVHGSDAWLNWSRGNAEAALDGFSGLSGSVGAWGTALALYDLGRDEEIDDAIAALLSAGGRPTQLALVEAYRDDADRAFEWLDRAYEEHDDWLIEIRMYDGFGPLYDDPRWEELLGRIGISDTDAERIGL